LLWNGLIEKHHFVTLNEFLIFGDLDLWLWVMTNAKCPC
jgi:hypothetical protein